MPKAKSNPTPNLEEIDRAVADVEQMIWVGIRATQDLRRGEDPAYYHLPARDSETLLFSLHDLVRRVEELRAKLSPAEVGAGPVKPARPAKGARKGSRK